MKLNKVALRVALATKNWNQRQLAQALGVAGNTLSGWITGAHKAPPGWIARAEKALGVKAGNLEEQ